MKDELMDLYYKLIVSIKVVTCSMKSDVTCRDCAMLDDVISYVYFRLRYDLVVAYTLML